ncbi:MAG: phage major capsid protein [bacterium]|nr:phage major capsid protein [bacterium]
MPYDPKEYEAEIDRQDREWLATDAPIKDEGDGLRIVRIFCRVARDLVEISEDLHNTEADVIALEKDKAPPAKVKRLRDKLADTNTRVHDALRDHIVLWNAYVPKLTQIFACTFNTIDADCVDSNNYELSKEFSAMLSTEIEKTLTKAPDCVAGGIPETKAAGVRPALSLTEKKFTAMFGPTSRASGFSSFDDYLRTVHSGLADVRLMTGATEAVPSEGGLVVPLEYARLLFDAALEDEVVRSRAQVWPMQSLSLQIPSFDAADHSSNLAGLKGSWLGEAAEASNQVAKLQAITLSAHKLAIFTAASNELIADGVNFETQLGAAMIRALSWNLDYYFLTGSGGGQPLGVLNCASTVEVAKESAQANATIKYENLTKMLARLHPACFKNSVWVCHPSTIPQLLGLSVVVGTGGSHYPVLSETNGQFSILTRPCVFSEKMAELGDAGDVLLADFSRYAIGLRRDVSLEKSVHVGWQTDQVGYRTIIRVDGRPLWPDAITPRVGTDSLSWAVKLGARTS